MKTYDTIKAAKAQEAYCDQHECPIFAPSDGICPRCGKNIYEPHSFRDHDAVYGFSIEAAGNQLITHCDHCNYSFVE